MLLFWNIKSLFNIFSYSYDDKNIVVTSAYDRPEIVDSSIAFFAEKNGIKSCVNLQLKTHKEKETVVIKDCKYAGYALNGTIIAWFTNYINGEYYYYDVNKDEISQIVYPKGINVFSLHSDKNAVYFNMRGEANYLFVIDNDRTVKKMQFPDAYSGTHFGRNKYGSYIKVEGPNMVGIKSFYW